MNMIKASHALTGILPQSTALIGPLGLNPNAQTHNNVDISLKPLCHDDEPTIDVLFSHADLENSQAFKADKKNTKPIKIPHRTIQKSRTRALANVDINLEIETVQEYMNKSGKKIIHPENHPAYKKAYEDLQSLVMKLVQAQDGDEPIHLIIQNDMTVNAHFIRSENGERIVIVNLGLLHFVESDDELAFVLGHELEHGVSEMEKHLENFDQKKPREYVESILLHRVIENEVDVKSILNRTSVLGYNPQAAIHFMKRMMQEFGDGVSKTHTKWSSRMHSIELAIAGTERFTGKEYQTQSVSTKIVGELKKEWLATEAFKEERRQLMQASLNCHDIGIDKFIEKLFSNQSHSGEIYFLNGFFETWTKIVLNRVKSAGSGIIKPKEWSLWEAYAHKAVVDEIERVMRRYLKDGYDNLSYLQLVYLKKFYQRRHSLEKYQARFNASPDTHPLAEMRATIYQNQRQLAVSKKKLSEEKDEEKKKKIHSIIIAIQNQNQVLEKKLSYISQLFPDSVQSTVNELMRVRYGIPAQMSDEERRQINYYETIQTLIQKIDEQQLIFSGLRKQTRKIQNQIRTSLLNKLINAETTHDTSDVIHMLYEQENEFPGWLEDHKKQVFHVILRSKLKSYQLGLLVSNPFHFLMSRKGRWEFENQLAETLQSLGTAYIFECIQKEVGTMIESCADLKTLVHLCEATLKLQQDLDPTIPPILTNDHINLVNAQILKLIEKDFVKAVQRINEIQNFLNNHVTEKNNRDWAEKELIQSMYKLFSLVKNACEGLSKIKQKHPTQIYDAILEMSARQLITVRQLLNLDHANINLEQAKVVVLANVRSLYENVSEDQKIDLPTMRSILVTLADNQNYISSTNNLLDSLE